MTIANLVCGIVGSIVATIIITVVTKVYLGISNYRGLKGSIRLLRDCYEGGIVNVFPCRKTYVQHKDHGTETQYISRSSNKLLYVGYWLAHGTEMGNIKQTIQKLIFDGKDVELVLLNPDNVALLVEIADYMQIDYNEMKQRINTCLSKMFKLKCDLPSELKEHFHIKIHNVPINASAFLIDYDSEKEMCILVDYKIYNQEREKSYGIEFRDRSKIMTKSLRESYLKIASRAKTYETEFTDY
ncbi:MAG: hypothetical protein LUK37_23975 [Clostridia bacterium]|nr:hypothetical protein [Clostridia bacterium]